MILTNHRSQKRHVVVALVTFCVAGLLPASAGQLGNLAVIGDSLSAGFQNGTLCARQQVHGYANLIAIQAQTPLILPLIAYPGIPPGAPRLNPLFQATDLAVPGQTVEQALTKRPNFGTGFPLNGDAVQVMTNFVLGFPGVFTLTARSQVEWANALAPDTVVVWLGSNDVLGVFEGLQNGITDPSTFANKLDQVLSSLTAGNGRKKKIVIANIPDVTLLPFMGPILADPKNAGLGPFLQSTVGAYNAAIQSLALQYGASVVDIYSVVNNLAEHGADINGQHLTTLHLGGLFSLDDIHPTNTGYAILANEFIKTINQAYNTHIPAVNLANVAATDPLVNASSTTFPPPPVCLATN